MIVKQFYLPCLAHASYMIADEGTKTAVVVDPQRDVDQYLQEACAHRWQIRSVFLTHFHADFLAGHLELQKHTGAEICMGSKAQADFPMTPFKDEEVLERSTLRETRRSSVQFRPAPPNKLFDSPIISNLLPPVFARQT